jgi:hypothetical protein
MFRAGLYARVSTNDLVQYDWREVALREIARRAFILNHEGTPAVIGSKLSTGWLGTASQVFWASFEDFGTPVASHDGGSVQTWMHLYRLLFSGIPR